MSLSLYFLFFIYVTAWGFMDQPIITTGGETLGLDSFNNKKALKHDFEMF